MRNTEEDTEGTASPTVSLNPTVRRALRDQGRSSLLASPLLGGKVREFRDCAHCYGIGLLMDQRGIEWSACPWCRDSSLVVIIRRVGDEWFVARDREGVWGRGICLVDALLDAERRTSDADSIWSVKYQCDDEDDEALLRLERRTWQLISERSRELGITVDEILSAAATGVFKAVSLMELVDVDDEQTNVPDEAENGAVLGARKLRTNHNQDDGRSSEDEPSALRREEVEGPEAIVARAAIEPAGRAQG